MAMQESEMIRRQAQYGQEAGMQELPGEDFDWIQTFTEHGLAMEVQNDESGIRIYATQNGFTRTLNVSQEHEIRVVNRPDKLRHIGRKGEHQSKPLLVVIEPTTQSIGIVDPFKSPKHIRTAEMLARSKKGRRPDQVPEDEIEQMEQAARIKAGEGAEGIRTIAFDPSEATPHKSFAHGEGEYVVHIDQNGEIHWIDPKERQMRRVPLPDHVVPRDERETHPSLSDAIADALAVVDQAPVIKQKMRTRPEDGRREGNEDKDEARTALLPKSREIILDNYIKEPEVMALGPIKVRTEDQIHSKEAPFRYWSEHQTNYPRSVTTALAQVYAEFNNAYDPIIEKNKEWDTDYQFCRTGPGGSPVNFGVQIDMVGLPELFLNQAATMNPRELNDFLRRRMFEIEPSLAGYGILGGMFKRDGQPTGFETHFRRGLDELREKHGKPIALLAVTEGKRIGMMEMEFGKHADEPISDLEVQQLSGFDTFLGPNELAELVRRYGDDLPYLLYARTSDPQDKLKDPRKHVDHPLLADDRMRRIIKAHAITMNVDNPEWAPGDPRRINDTKEYLGPMGMGYRIDGIEEIYSPDFIAYLASKGKQPNLIADKSVFSAAFEDYLRDMGVDPLQIQSGEVDLRFKPEQGYFGCYGHEHGSILHWFLRKEVKRHMEGEGRGKYVIQPEMSTPIMVDLTNINQGGQGQPYRYIDRNFVFTSDNINFQFLGGFRSSVMIGSGEEKAGRVHGSEDTIWSEIVEAPSASAIITL